jgi:Asp-tRNA(Asn)/Glu-tRNA(Gln) amidotransferase C subunit
LQDACPNDYESQDGQTDLAANSMYQPMNYSTDLRDDVAVPQGRSVKQAIFANTAVQHDGFFAVPKVRE